MRILTVCVQAFVRTFGRTYLVYALVSHNELRNMHFGRGCDPVLDVPIQPPEVLAKSGAASQEEWTDHHDSPPVRFVSPLYAL